VKHHTLDESAEDFGFGGVSGWWHAAVETE